MYKIGHYTNSFVLIREVYEPSLLEPLSVPLLGVFDGLHDAHEWYVGAGRGGRAVTCTRVRSTRTGGC